MTSPPSQSTFDGLRSLARRIGRSCYCIKGFQYENIEINRLAKYLSNSFFHWQVISGQVEDFQIKPSQPCHASQGKAIGASRHD